MLACLQYFLILLSKIAEKFKNGENVIIKRGKWMVGLDIPEGEYVISNASDRGFNYLIAL